MAETGGILYLVGAGPGDPKLLTLRGKECLEQADVVLYDYLANPALLEYAPDQAERIYVGRRGRGKYLEQEEINEILLHRVRSGKRVVRLKGGDPFIFGRGGEEAEAAAEAGIAFEVVPGVTSAVSVPAYAGIPVTHRTLASAVTVVTGHEDATKSRPAVEWPTLAAARGTLVCLMGIKNLAVIVRRLLEGGKASDTPAALIRWGTYPRQQTIVGTLSDIVEKAESAHMDPPAVCVIGEVVRLRERLNWFERRPLFGLRVLVTRAKDQAHELSALLSRYGAEPVEWATIRMIPPETWEDLDEAVAHLDGYQWLIFTSVNGVHPFMARLRRRGLDARALRGLRICCIGPRTAEELSVYGVSADLVPAVFQAEGVIEALKQAGVSGQRILIPRAAAAREILPDELRALGAEVRVVAVYRTAAPSFETTALKALFRDRTIQIVTFASSSTVRNFCDLFESLDELHRMMAGVKVACIGPITAETARAYGLGVDILPSENTIPALVQAIVDHVQHDRSEALPT